MEMFLGVVVSLFVQYLKNVLKFGEYATLGAVAIVSVAFAGVYAYLDSSGLMPAVVSILTTAGAFYAFIIARFEKKSTDTL